MSLTKIMLSGLCAGILLTSVACGAPATEAPPTAEPTTEVIVLPTAAEPTSQAATEPTAPPPTSADPAIPTIVTENLAGVTVLRIDPFDQLDSNFWEFDPALAAASAGNLNITGNKNWTTGLKLRRTLLEGQAIMVKFQMAKGTNFGIQIANGTPGTPEYRSYGFYRPQAVMVSRVMEGTLDVRQDVPLKGDLNVHHFNTWYYCLLGVRPKGHFFLLVWDAADPTQFNRVHDVLNESWWSKEWAYTIEIKDGTLMLDEAVELQFENVY